MNVSFGFLNNATTGAIASETADLKVPVLNLILVGAALVLLIAAAVVGILVLRNHVRSWLYPFGVGLVFHLVLRYTLFNSRFGLMPFLFGLMSSNIPFLKGQDVLLSEILIVLEIASIILAVILGLAYWKKGALRDRRPFTVGGALAFGFSAYIVSVIASGYLSQFYGVLSNGMFINWNGFDTVLQSFLSQAPAEEADQIRESLLLLTGSDPTEFVHCLLWSFVVILESFVPVAMSVIRYGVISEQMGKKWNWVVVALPVLMVLPPAVHTLMDGFPAFPFISFGYALVIAALSAFLIVFVSNRYMEKEWSALSYTRKKQKRDEEKEKNKMPKIQMPKD